MSEQKPKPVSTFELYEDEEFVVTKFSASSKKSNSFSMSSENASDSRSVMLNPEDL